MGDEATMGPTAEQPTAIERGAEEAPDNFEPKGGGEL